MAATILISIILAGLFLLGLRTLRQHLVSGCCGGSGEAVHKMRVSDRDPAHYQYAEQLNIGGMHCKSCAIRVQNALNSLDGVYATVDLDSKTSKVLMKERLPERALLSAVEKAGYSASFAGRGEEP